MKIEIMRLEADLAKQGLLIKQQELQLQREGLAMKQEAAREAHRMKLEAIRAKPKKEPANAAV